MLRSYLIPGEKDSVVPLSYAKSFSGRVVWDRDLVEMRMVQRVWMVWTVWTVCTVYQV